LIFDPEIKSGPYSCASSLFLSNPPKRTQPKVAKCQTETKGDQQACGALLSSLIFDIFPRNGQSTDERQCQENKACYFEPKLVQDARKGADGGAQTVQHRRTESALPRLPAQDSGQDTDLPHCRKIRQPHDFTSLKRQSPRLEWERVSGHAQLWKWCRIKRAGTRETKRNRRDEGTAMDDQSGGQVDQQLKQLMNELGAAINESLADSEQIAEVVSRIKDGGYDIFLVLEATIGVSKQSDKSSEKTSLVTTLSSNADLKISEQDLKFLKSLRIKLDEEEKKQ
jgi:hypothetical protein